MSRLLVLIVVIAATSAVAVVFWSAREPRADFVYVSSLEPRTLDPALSSWIDEIRTGRCLFEGLTRLNDRTFRPEPGVAERWDISADRKRYTFHLRTNARWYDGKTPGDAGPVTADDFLFAWQRVLNPVIASEYFYQLFPIRGAKEYYLSRADRDPSNDRPFNILGARAIDPQTLEVELAFPCPYFLDLAAFMTLAPVHRPTIERWAYRDGRVLPTQHLWTRPGNLVCNGPFMIDKWDFKRRIRLRKNPLYWDAASIRLNTMEAVPIEDNNTALLAYETGAVDMVSELNPMALRALYTEKRAGRRSDFSIRPRFGTYFYRFNCKRPPLNDARVRKALSLTIDRTAICDRIMASGHPPMFTYVPPGSLDEMIQQDAQGRDHRYASAVGIGQDLTPEQRRDLARRLLVEAGYPNGRGLRPLELLYNRDQRHHLIAQAVARTWEEQLGLKIELKQIERNVFSPRVESLDYDVARGNWIGDYPDPMTFLDMFVTGGGHNQTGFANAAYDRLIQEAVQEAHPGKRFEILRKAEAVLVHDELPIAPIFEYVGFYLLNPRFDGLYPDSQLNLLVHRTFPKRTGPTEGLP